MFDDNNNGKTEPDNNALSVAPAPITAPSLPTEGNSVSVDPTMSSAPAPPPTNPQATTNAFNTTAVPEITAHSSAIGGEAYNATSPIVSSNSADSTNNEELVELKQKALQSLSPLLSHLDQTPEEKFRTTMMMIQASDDQSLVKIAYDAAQNITDEKSKAQALLDIVNEINYFTQHGKN